MPAGEFGGLVSLGVFRKAAGAERRRAQIAALGFKAEIRTRRRDELRWWVTLHADNRSLPQPTATAALLSGPTAAGAQMLPCTASEVPAQLRSTPAQALPARESTQLSQRSTQRK